METVIDAIRGRGAWRLLAILVLLVGSIPGCNSGDECDTCSADEDCQAEFVCSTFSDGSQRCGSGIVGQETECRVR
jgi:hypothetical protein